MIEHDLMPVLHQTAKSMGLGVGADCESAVRSFIMQADGVYRSSSPQDRVKIKTQFETFVMEMGAEAQRLGLTELRERTLAAAMTKLCPFWPFC